MAGVRVYVGARNATCSGGGGRPGNWSAPLDGMNPMGPWMRWASAILLTVWAAAAPPLPPVYFDHLLIVVNRPTYQALSAAPFLRQEFSNFYERTTYTNSGKSSYTGLYVMGR